MLQNHSKPNIKSSFRQRQGLRLQVQRRNAILTDLLNPWPDFEIESCLQNTISLAAGWIDSEPVFLNARCAAKETVGKAVGASQRGFGPDILKFSLRMLDDSAIQDLSRDVPQF